MDSEIECNKCGWQGAVDERTKVPTEARVEGGYGGFYHVCPKCGNNEFYCLTPTH